MPSIVKGTGGNTRPTGFTITESRRKDDIRNNTEDTFMSTSKRKRTFKNGSDAFKFPSDNSNPFAQGILHEHDVVYMYLSYFNTDRMTNSDRTSSYAQRMAEAHLRSSGLGQYTPKQSGIETWALFII